jgi:hypothetical protein
MEQVLGQAQASGPVKEVDGLAINAEVMFSDHKGRHKPRIEKRQRKLLSQMPFLSDFLEEGETIQVVTTAVSPTSLVDQWTTGYIYVYIKRCFLIITDRRMLHVPTTINYKYRRSIAQVCFGDVDSIVQRGAHMKIKYTSGGKDQFLHLRRAERKKIRVLFKESIPEGSTSNAGKRAHLCPHCTTELNAGVYACGNCALEFKSRKTALKLSVWLPGGGYFYTGHPILGLLDAAVELFLILAIIGAWIPDASGSGGGLAAAGVFAIMLLIEKLITVYHADNFIREYLPRDKQIKPANQFAMPK